MYIGRWWHWIEENEKLQCDLCPRGCIMHTHSAKDPNKGQEGFCFVRRATPKGVELTTYGRSSGFCIDPIEKKPLNHFYPASTALSFGTVGCNLGCMYCQNWDISKAKSDDRLLTTATPEQIAKWALQKNCKSVAYTYNDPVIFAEYAIDIAKVCREKGIFNIAVTAGYITPEPREEFFKYMDATNVDLKYFKEESYQKYSLAHLEPVLDTLKYLVHKTDVWVELTNLVVPGLNDSEKEVKDMCAWICKELRPDVPLHFSAYHPDYKMKQFPATSAKILTQVREWAIAEGVKYVYTGNVHDRVGESTYCPECKTLLIERDWYDILQNKIVDGKCPQCKMKIAGHF